MLPRDARASLQGHPRIAPRWAMIRARPRLDGLGAGQTGAQFGRCRGPLEDISLDSIKSIAVPVTRKRAAAAKPKRAGKPSSVPGGHVGGHVGPARRSLSGATAPAPKHRFHLGERLRMVGGGMTLRRDESICRVTLLLPHEGGPLLYRVRSELESFERVVAESDLSSVS